MLKVDRDRRKSLKNRGKEKGEKQTFLISSTARTTVVLTSDGPLSWCTYRAQRTRERLVGQESVC
jgi:hypothetical protein